jgi:hypothetical protein
MHVWVPIEAVYVSILFPSCIYDMYICMCTSIDILYCHRTRSAYAHKYMHTYIYTHM